MLQVKGLSIKQADKRADRLVSVVNAEMASVATQVSKTLGEFTVADSSPAAVSLSDLNPIRTLWEAIVDGRLLSIIAAAMFSSSGTVSDNLNRVVGRDISSPIGEDTISELALQGARNQLVNIGEDLWTEARDSLTVGMQEGESIPKLAARVQEAAEVTKPRAEVIARTEILRASNAGSITTMRASGLVTFKTWLATPDARTRPTHRAADGQSVPIDDPFQIGGETDDEGNVTVEGVNLDHPGDPMGPANETIQCRCVMTYEVEEDELPELEEGWDDWEEPTTAALDDDHSHEGMIALVPSAADAQRMALEGGEDVDELHLTLAYLGQTDGWTDQQTNALRDAVEAVANGSGPIDAEAFGVAQWNPGSDSPSWVLSVGGDGLEDVHASTWDAIKDTEGLPELAAQHTPWAAHVCLAYSDDPAVLGLASASLGPILFDRIRFALGDDVFDFPIGGTLNQDQTEASAMPWYIEKNHEGCSGDTPWAVVNEDTDEVEGCYSTRADALAQMAGLADDGEDDSTASAKKTASKGNVKASSKGTRPSRKTRALAADKPDPKDEVECPEGEHAMPNGECMPDGDMDSSGQVVAFGIATREGEWTGDGRQFADGSLEWPDPAEVSIPLQWQKETSHGGVNDVTVNVGWLTALVRLEGGQIGYDAIIDTDSADGMEAARFVAKRGKFGVSIVADDPEQAEMEFVYPDGCEEAEGESLDADEMDMRCFMPNVVYHSGRIRALTLVDVPAFADAYIQIEDTENLVAALGSFGAVAVHETATTDEDWDSATQEAKLESPMDVDTARAMYAWIDDAEIEGDEVVKAACKFPHHEVNDDGTPGAANLAACSSGIGALNGARSEPDIPAGDRQGVYDHLAAHLRAADQEPPEAEFDTEEDALTAAYSIEIPDLPPAEWFAEPTELPEIGAIKVTDEGRIFGLLAPRGVSHRSFQDRRVTVPMGNVDYSRWMNRETITAGGKRIAAGPVTMECGHASTSASVTSQASRDHYDNSCSVFATVRVGENRHGVWVAGAILPGVTAEQIARAMALQLSGDWRPHPEKPGKREMCGALLVPVPGFPTENRHSGASMKIENGQLVAASVPMTWEITGDIPSSPAGVVAEPVELASADNDGLPTWDDIKKRRELRAKVEQLRADLNAKE